MHWNSTLLTRHFSSNTRNKLASHLIHSFASSWRGRASHSDSPQNWLTFCALGSSSPAPRCLWCEQLTVCHTSEVVSLSQFECIKEITICWLSFLSPLSFHSLLHPTLNIWHITDKFKNNGGAVWSTTTEKKWKDFVIFNDWDVDDLRLDFFFLNLTGLQLRKEKVQKLNTHLQPRSSLVWSSYWDWRWDRILLAWWNYFLGVMISSSWSWREDSNKPGNPGIYNEYYIYSCLGRKGQG